jgi:hypothetical protein
MDAQYSIVRARIYEAEKQDPVKNLKQGKCRVAKIATRRGHAATARKVAKETGVSWRTILNDVKFKEAWERLQEISPKAAEIVLRDEVKDAKTELPKVPKEAFSFVANSQTPPLSRQGWRSRAYLMEALS